VGRDERAGPPPLPCVCVRERERVFVSECVCECVCVADERAGQHPSLSPLYLALRLSLASHSRLSPLSLASRPSLSPLSLASRILPLSRARGLVGS